MYCEIIGARFWKLPAKNVAIGPAANRPMGMKIKLMAKAKIKAILNTFEASFTMRLPR